MAFKRSMQVVFTTDQAVPAAQVLTSELKNVQQGGASAAAGIDQTRDALGRFTATAKDGQGAVSGLSESIHSVTGAAHEHEGALGSLSEGYDKLGEKIGEALGELALMAVAFLTVEQAVEQTKKSIEEFGAFQKSLDAIQANTGATAQEMQSLADAAKEVGSGLTVFSAGDAAQGLQVLQKAGETASDSITQLTDIEHLAVIGHESLKEAADDLTLSINRFNVPASESSKVVDTLATVSAHSRAQVGDLVDVMKQAGPTAGAMGLQFNDLAATLGVMAQQGGNVRQMGSALVLALSALSQGSAKTTADLARLHLTLADVSPATHSVEQIISTLARAGLDATTAFNLFGPAAGGAILKLTTQIPQLNAMKAAIDANSGAGEHMAEVMEQGVEAAMEKAGQAFASVRLEIGEGMAPALKTAAEEWNAFAQSGREGAQAFGSTLGQALGAVSGAVIILAKNFDLIKAGVEAFLVLKAAEWLTGLAVAGGKAAAVLIATSIAEAEAADTALVLTAELALQAEMAGIDAASFMATAGAIQAAETASVEFLSVALTPMTVGLAAIAGVFLLLNERVKAWGDAMEQETARIVGDNNKFAAGLADLKKRYEDLTTGTLAQAAAQKELLIKGVSADSPEGKKIILDAEIASRSKVVDLLGAEKSALDKAEESAKNEQKAIDLLKSGLPDLIAKEQALKATAIGGDAGERAAYTQASAAIDEANEELDKHADALTRAKIAAKEAAKEEEGLSKLLDGMAKPAAPKSLPIEKPQGQSIEESVRLREVEAAGIMRLAQAQAHGTEAVRAATVAADIDKEMTQLATKYQSEHKSSIEAAAAAVEVYRARIAAAAKQKSDATNITKQGTAAYQEEFATLAAYRMNAAKVTDAMTGNTIASQLLAVQLKAEGEARAWGMTQMGSEGQVLSDLGQQWVDHAAKVALDTIQSGIHAKQITDDRVAEDALATAHAGYADAVNRSTDASRAEVTWQKLRNEAMQAGVNVFEFMLTAQGKKLTADQQELAMTEKLTNAQRTLDSVKSQAELAASVGAISTALPANEQEAEKQFLTYVQNIGSGSIAEGQKILAQQAKDMGVTLGALTNQILGYYQSISDASVSAQIAGASKSPYQVYQEKQDQLTRIATDNADKNIALANDANATMTKNTQDFWAGQVSTWKSAVDNLAKIGGKVGEIFAAIGSALGAVQQAQQTQASISSAATSLGASAGTSSALGVVGLVVSIFTSIYDGLEAHINKVASETYGTGNASVSIIGGDVGISYLDNEGQKVVDEIKKVVKQFGDALGGSITDLSSIGVQIRNDGKYVASYVQNQFVGHFATVDEAIQAALEYELQTGALKIKGMSDLVMQGIKSFTESDFTAETAFLDQLKQIDDLAKTQGQISLETTVHGLDDLFNALTQLKDATPAVVQGFLNISNAEDAAWQQWSDSITGRKQTAAELLKIKDQEGEMFNAEREMRIADLALRKIDLEQQLAILKAKEAMLVPGGTGNFSGGDSDPNKNTQNPNISQAQSATYQSAELTATASFDKAMAQLAQADIQTKDSYLKAQADLLPAQSDIYTAQIGMIEAEIAAVQKIIDNMPAAIDIPSIRLPNQGGGGNPQQTALDLLTQHRHDLLGQEGQAIDDINKKYADAIKAAGKNKDLIAQLTAARLEEIAALEKQVKAQYLTPFLGGQYAGSRSDYAKTLADEDAAQKDLIATHLKLGIAAWQINAAFREMHRILGLQVLSDLGIESASLVLKYQQEGQAISFLKDHMTELGLTLPQLTADLQELSDVTELGIFGKISQYITNEKELAEYKEIQYELDVARAKEELALAYASGAITLEAYNRLGGSIYGMPTTMPVAADAGSGGSAYSASLAASANTQQTAADTQLAAADKLTQWQQSLMTNPATSPLAPRAQVAQSAADLQATFQAAMGGDTTARDNFTTQADAYLALFSNTFGRNGAFAAEVIALSKEADQLKSTLTGNPAQNLIAGPWAVSGGFYQTPAQKKAADDLAYQNVYGTQANGNPLPPPPPPPAPVVPQAPPAQLAKLDDIKTAVTNGPDANSTIIKTLQLAHTANMKYQGSMLPLAVTRTDDISKLRQDMSDLSAAMKRIAAKIAA